jgi:tetratricopeptide (TPR) repeat protein
MRDTSETRTREIAIAVGLALATMLLFGRTAAHDFVSLDDPSYVLDNPMVRRGLTPEGFRWAFSSFHSFNWHPLTWLSHMLDVTLFGIAPAGHHLVNASLHALNAALCFAALRALTGALWSSALIAALFALHPLRVESVAWVAERKDLLGGFFWMVALFSYAGYARRPSWPRYAIVFGATGLGLLAKPVVVTLPVILLLLDFWPLGRIRPLVRSIAEKLPLVALCAAAGLITVLAQESEGAVRSLSLIPLWARVSNALLAYVAYLGDALWPSGLAVFYPHPALLGRAGSTLLPATAAGLSLAIVTAVSLRRARRNPYLTVGWLWYLVALLPMIGLVQVGGQARADRYTYLPMIGIGIALVFLAREVARNRRPALLVGTSLLVLSTLAAATWRQLDTWRDSETLFAHATQVTEDNYFAYSNLGKLLRRRGDLAGARTSLERALVAKPDYIRARIELGDVLERQGDLDRATQELERVVRARPQNARAHNVLGRVLWRRERREEATRHFERAVALDPRFAEAHDNLGLAYLGQGRLLDAQRHFQRAVALQPDAAPPRAHLHELEELLAR